MDLRGQDLRGIQLPDLDITTARFDSNTTFDERLHQQYLNYVRDRLSLNEALQNSENYRALKARIEGALAAPEQRQIVFDEASRLLEDILRKNIT